MIGVYEILNKSNNKRYIGSSKNIDSRFKVHLTKLLNGKHFNRHLQGAWNKYGSELFEFNIVEICEIKNLLTCEKYYINEFNALSRADGYNIAPDPTSGSRGIKWNQESREKLSRSLVVAYSDGSRKRADFSHSIEAKGKISAAATGRIPINRKSIWCHQTGMEYNSIHCAAKNLKISTSGVMDNIAGRLMSIHGYTFEYANISNREIKPKILKTPKIICIETGIIYDNQTAAAKSIGIKSGDVGKAIKRNGKNKGFTFKKVK